VRSAHAAGTAAPASDAPAPAGSGASAASGAPAVCITDQAMSVLNTCPNGPKTLSAGGKKPEVKLHAAVEELKHADKKNGVGGPDVNMAAGIRDLRQTALHQRLLNLLITSIQQTESLLRTTPARAPDRPQLLRRLAEDYVELENAAFREKTEAEIKRDDLKAKGNTAGAGQSQATANARKTTMEGARKAAIKYYNLLVTDYNGSPSNTFANNPPPAYPQLDEVYYYLAYEYEQANDTANARRVYLDLITKTPSSKYIPNAYLAFGELFFNEAQGDPSKWGAAMQSYQKVIQSPPPGNKVYGYAWYKLAYVFWNMNDLPHALDAFKKVVDFGTQFTQVAGSGKLADSARKDVIPVYAQAGRPTDT
jgi:tetratricopeptide (TPR) repeat protein